MPEITLQKFATKYPGIIHADTLRKHFRNHPDAFPRPVGMQYGGERGRMAPTFDEEDLKTYIATWQEARRARYAYLVPYWVQILEQFGYTVTKDNP